MDRANIQELQPPNPEKHHNWEEEFDPSTPVPHITIGDQEIEAEERACFLNKPLSLVTTCITNKLYVLVDLHGQRWLYCRIQAFDKEWNAIITNVQEHWLAYNKRKGK